MTDQFIEFMGSAKTNPLKKDIQLLEMKNAELASTQNLWIWFGAGFLLGSIIVLGSASPTIPNGMSIPDLRKKESWNLERTPIQGLVKMIEYLLFSKIKTPDDFIQKARIIYYSVE